MRRLLPLLLVALLAIIAWAILDDGNNEQPLDTDWQDPELTQVDDPVATPTDSGPSRIGEAVAAPAEFTNRPVKKGYGRHGLHGIVVDENGEPVENAWVGAYSSPFPIADFIESPAEILEKPLALSLDPLASAFTDKDGRFTLGGVPGRSVYLTARKKMRLSRGRMRVSTTDLNSENGVTIKTYAAASLSGQVVDEHGSPVPNAEVLVNPGLKFIVSAVRSRDIFLERTFTDAGGNFEVEAVPAGMVLAVSAFDGATHPGIADFGPAARNTSAKVRVELSEIGQLSGRVLDTEEKPVRNANVAAIPLDLRMVVPVLRDVPAWISQSDGGGNYRFNQLPQGQYLLVAQSDEGRSGPVSTRIIGVSGSEQDVVIDTQNEVIGRVLNTKGEPIPNAVVSLMSVPETDALEQGARRNSMNFLLEMAREALPEILPADTTSTTDAKGRFELAAWNRARVRVEATGYVTADFRFRQMPKDKTPVLIMQRPGAIEGQVVTVGDQPEPVSYYILQCDRRSSDLRAVEASQEVEVRSGVVQIGEVAEPSGQSGSSGKQSIGGPELQAALGEDEFLLVPSVQPMAEFKNSQFVDDPKGRFKAVGLSPGRYRLKVRAEGYETGREMVDVVEGEITKDVVIKMGIGATVTGLVVDKNTGDPVSGAMISVDHTDEGGFALLAQGFTEGNQVTLSKDDGSFELRGVEADSEYAHVMASNYSMHSMKIEPIQEGEVRGPIKLELLPGGGITGRVTDRHGTPLSQRMVIAFSPGSRDFHQSGTDEGGVYLIEHLRPGNYMLISAALDDESLFTGDFASILSGGKLVPTTVSEGEITEQDIVDPAAGGCKLSGTLTKAGAPVPNAALTAMSMGGASFFDFRMASARTDENGNFEFKSIAPGEYSVNVESSDWRGALDLFVDDIPEDWVGLRIPETVVTGQVVSASNQTPLKGVRVSMVREDGPSGLSAMFGGGGGPGGRRSATTDEHGQYRIEGAPPGDYHLVLEPAGRSWRRSDQGEAKGVSYRKLESRSFFLDEDETREMDTFELIEAGRVNVLVFDDSGEKFQQGFRLRAVPADGGKAPEGSGDLSGWGWDGKGEIQGIPAGRWEIQIEARGYALESKEATIAPGQDAELEFRLRTGVPMQVRIIGKNGKPAPSAAVTVFNSDGKRLKSDGGGGGAMIERFFTGGSDGTRTLGTFAEGPYKLEVSLDGDTSEHHVNLVGGGNVIEVRL